MDRDDWLTVVLPGWQPLLRELDGRLRERWPGYAISQVKEKFGTLRFYADPGLPHPGLDLAEDDPVYVAWADQVGAFYALVGEFEERSARLCEQCGEPGRLGSNGSWLSTRCPRCAPPGWVVDDVDCDHPSVTGDACDDCGQGNLARLEHSLLLLSGVHPDGSCWGTWCTVHRRSDHSMRSFPQQWRGDRAIMERVCPHGVGHPDPDEYRLSGPQGADLALHGCDGCCAGGVT